MLDRFAAEADRLEAEARSIRGRVTRASSSSQHVMRAEAAALERAARRIRHRRARARGRVMPVRADHRDLQASAECRSRLIAALLMTMAATVGLT